MVWSGSGKPVTFRQILRGTCPGRLFSIAVRLNTPGSPPGSAIFPSSMTLDQRFFRGTLLRRIPVHVPFLDVAGGDGTGGTAEGRKIAVGRKIAAGREVVAEG